MNMNGVVVVGTGVEDVPEPVEKDTDATPGFGGALLVLAVVMGAFSYNTKK